MNHITPSLPQEGEASARFTYIQLFFSLFSFSYSRQARQTSPSLRTATETTIEEGEPTKQESLAESLVTRADSNETRQLNRDNQDDQDEERGTLQGNDAPTNLVAAITTTTATLTPRRSVRIRLHNEERPGFLKSPTSSTTSPELAKKARQKAALGKTLLAPKPVRKTLILDLDETLIHSVSKGGKMSSGHMIEVKLGPAAILYYVHKRPYCDHFLRKVSTWYDMVIFTASVQAYADPVIDWLEQERPYFKARYYRQHCTFRYGAYMKDLAVVDPNPSKTIIVDNSPLSYRLNEENAIPIEGWINDPSDNDLLYLIPMLQSLRFVYDVRSLLSLRGQSRVGQHQQQASRSTSISRYHGYRNLGTRLQLLKSRHTSSRTKIQDFLRMNLRKRKTEDVAQDEQPMTPGSITSPSIETTFTETDPILGDGLGDYEQHQQQQQQVNITSNAAILKEKVMGTHKIITAWAALQQKYKLLASQFEKEREGRLLAERRYNSMKLLCDDERTTAAAKNKELKTELNKAHKIIQNLPPMNQLLAQKGKVQDLEADILVKNREIALLRAELQRIRNHANRGTDHLDTQRNLAQQAAQHPSARSSPAVSKPKPASLVRADDPASPVTSLGTLLSSQKQLKPGCQSAPSGNTYPDADRDLMDLLCNPQTSNDMTHDLSQTLQFDWAEFPSMPQLPHNAENTDLSFLTSMQTQLQDQTNVTLDSDPNNSSNNTTVPLGVDKKMQQLRALNDNEPKSHVVHDTTALHDHQQMNLDFLFPE